MHRHLTQPLSVRSLTLPNRIVMGSMHLGLETAPDAFERLAEFYAERARGGAGLIVTGGVAPNPAGRFGADGAVLDSEAQLPGHRRITEAVHAAGGRIVMQVLHCGRYGKHADIVAPSAIAAPINRHVPRELSEADIEATIADYLRCARLARAAGYDGVEVMASEGYLLSEFLAPRTNKRGDRWGGSLDNRMRLLVSVVAGIRAALDDGAVLMVRLTVADLVEDGLTGDEVVAVARAVESAGADILNTGIGWHESKVPTIASPVPAGAWTGAVARVKRALSIPVAASNRINTPDLAEAILARGDCDLVSLARPMLADPAFAAKAASGAAINVCIGCNQGCLDAMFSGEWATCLVNPRAGRETDMPVLAATPPRRIAVVGGGPGGLACAESAAARGHAVTLFEAAAELGGQFGLALAVPGKEEYLATPAYFARRLAELGVDVRLNHPARAEDVAGFDAVVVATGVRPRRLELPGAELPQVVGYEDILSGRVTAGRRVVILGSSGIGHDVAAYLVADAVRAEDFAACWGVDPAFAATGAVAPPAPPPVPARQVVMMQRKPGRPGAGLGKTTGWIHRALLTRYGVQALTGVTYRAIDAHGIHVEVDGQPRFVEADTIVACIGQTERAELAEALAGHPELHRIGGARRAEGLDARRAIAEGMELGMRL